MLPDKKFEKTTEAKLDEKIDSYEPGRVFIFPTLQMNVIGYREDENLFLKLLSHLG